MQDKLPEILITSVHDVFLTFLGMEVFPGKAQEVALVESCQNNKTVTVVIDVSGDFEGSLHLYCSVVVALRLSSSMANKSFASMSGEASDVLGELLTLIAKWFQINSSQISNISISPAIVVSGNKMEQSQTNSSSCLKQSFKVNEDSFIIECLLTN
ncbi:MAG: chemotaxis protein CheX [Magnetococcales bacterium]|nr:chemotaxis protein CheX [Magnetococcales bacterium]